MSGRTRLALCAALTTALGALALRPVIAPCSWYWTALGAVLVVTLVGVAARKLSLPLVLVTILQLAGLIEWGTLIFERTVALGGFVPGPGVLSALWSLLNSGQADIRNYATPLPANAGDQVLLITLVGLLAVAIDLLAVGLGHTAATGLPLLAVYCVPAVETRAGVPWYVFALGAASYLILLMADSRERMLRWGRPLATGGPRGQDQSRLRAEVVPLASAGARIAVVVLVVAVGLPGLLPSFNGWAWQPSHIQVSSSGVGLSVQPLVDVASELNESQDLPILTVTTNAPADQLYLKMYTLDTVHGGQWTLSPTTASSLPSTFPAPEGLSNPSGVRLVTSDITVQPNETLTALPMPSPVHGVRVGGSWQVMNGSNDVLLLNGTSAGGFSYGVDSYELNPPSADFTDPGSLPSDVAKDTDLSSLSSTDRASVTNTALAVTRSATNDLQKARLLQDYFTQNGGFTYTLDVNYTGPNPTTEFLQQRKGFCQQFASTMALMARAVGIPARVAVGFNPGTQNANGQVVVGTSNAHAWPELYFGGVGWMRFEPTPTQAGTAPGYALPGSSASTPTTPQASATPGVTASPQATPTAGSTQKPAVTAPPTPVTAGGQHVATGSGGSVWPWVLLFGGVPLILVLAALTPMALRSRVRRSRRTAHITAGGDTRIIALAAWAELSDVVRDYGIVWSAAETPRQVRDRLRRLLGTDLEGQAAHKASVAAPSAVAPDSTALAPQTLAPQTLALWEAGDVALARLCEAYETALFSPRYAFAGDLFEDVGRVEAVIASRASQGARFVARVFPRSTLRSLGDLRVRRRSALDVPVPGQPAGAEADLGEARAAASHSHKADTRATSGRP